MKTKTAQTNARVLSLHDTVLATPPALCVERAVLVTEYFRSLADPAEPMVIQKARALNHILSKKVAHIYPQELLVGNFNSKRVGGSIFPELHGVSLLEDLFSIETRKTNPFRLSKQERWQLIKGVFPFWMTRFLVYQAMPLRSVFPFIAHQLDPTSYLINEGGGISHIVPDYAQLVALGTEGLRAAARARLEGLSPQEPGAGFLKAVDIALTALETFADTYRLSAEKEAALTPEPGRRQELLEIARAVGHAPRHPARSFREALQAILLAQIALNLESLDNSVCPGRLDQILGPYYRRDIESGVLNREGALELLGCFAVKLCEIVPAFSTRVTKFHGGLFSGQVVVVGGTDAAGQDATNEVTFLFLELMDALRTRQPNYHARLHSRSPGEYRTRIAQALAAGAVSPALYNDDVIVPNLERRGVAPADARDYALVGCVEPVSAGRSFCSTDAALLNLPLCLELALNQGKRFGSGRRTGVNTPPAEDCGSAEELFELFASQLRFMTSRLLSELSLIEQANARYHPTPLTSALLRGCVEQAKDATEGGAQYNGSGLQAVGAVDVADSFAAMAQVVFEEKRTSLAELLEACRTNFVNHEALHRRLCDAPKFGNDDARADLWTARVMELFALGLSGRKNTRGGDYVAGFYSVTAHAGFGELVGALPSGRLAGRPFSSGISPTTGAEARGPTASIRSVAGLPAQFALNGINYNLKLSPGTDDSREGAPVLRGLMDGAMALGCMQMQVNVLDPQVLMEARQHPGRYPGLLVRVSGYSAYFDDLSLEMKDEIIQRTLFEID